MIYGVEPTATSMFGPLSTYLPARLQYPDEWVDMIAGGGREKAKEYQSLYVHTFGNLTITGYNSTLSNKAFAEKKERKDSNGQYIGCRNGLNLNYDVCDDMPFSANYETSQRKCKMM